MHDHSRKIRGHWNSLNREGQSLCFVAAGQLAQWLLPICVSGIVQSWRGIKTACSYRRRSTNWWHTCGMFLLWQLSWYWLDFDSFDLIIKLAVFLNFLLIFFHVRNFTNYSYVLFLGFFNVCTSITNTIQEL